MSEQNHTTEADNNGPISERSLAEIAFGGIFYGQGQHSRLIFDFLERQSSGESDKSDEIFLVGQAFSHISEGQYDEAKRILESRILKQNPDCEEALVFMAVIHKLTGHASFADQICDRLQKSETERIRRLSEEIRGVRAAL